MTVGTMDQLQGRVLGGLGYIPKIMIVDDDDAHLQFIRMVILKENFTCELTLSNNALQALEMLRRNPVDLVLLDVMMPRMNGFEMIARLRKDPETRGIPVIFLTSSQETDHVVLAYESGAVDYISKPINSSVLAVRIQSILQRIMLENELKLRNEELQQLNRFKDELLSVCSHDLRSPLAAIEVICGSLKEEGAGGTGVDGNFENNRTLADKILNQSRLARRLVDNLLNYDKLEEGVLLPSPSFFQVRDFLLDCAEQEQPVLQARELEFKVELRDEDALLFGDHELLAQAVRNVLGNAINYAGSTIALSARVEGITPEEGGRLVIEISDDGPGIEPGKRSEIFNKYSKIDPNGGGSGLGLYIASKVVEMHSGRIAAGVSPGWATTFTLDLPNAFSPEQLPDLSAASEVKGKVISPSRYTGQLLESVLLEAGMVFIDVQITDIVSPEMLMGDRPDFAVIDLESPETNFFKLAKTINQTKAEIRWIFYGSRSKVETFERLVKVPYSHLPAPLNPLVLLNRINRLPVEDAIKSRG